MLFGPAGQSYPVPIRSAIRANRAPVLFSRAYSALFLRRRTINPISTTANTAQIMRIMELSITFLLSAKMSLVYFLSAGSTFALRSIRLYMLLIIGISSRMMRIVIGPTVTTNRVGMIQKKIGKTNFTPSFAAFSSATCRACVRI